MKLGTAIAACAAMALSAQASAQGFFGGSLGRSDIDQSIASGLITSGTIDGKDSAFKLFGGYFFGPHFGAEAAYVDLGAAGYSGSFFGTPVTGGSVDIWGYNIAALARFPLGERFALFGKLGLFLWESEASDVTGGAPFSSSTKGWDASFGLGASLRFTRSLSARLEWEQFSVGPSDAGLLSLGLQYSF